MRVCLLVTLGLCFFNYLFGQPTYDRSYYPEAEETVTQLLMDSAFAEQFVQGAEKTWQYPDSSSILDTIETNRIKASQAPGSDQFPDADIATINTNTVQGSQTTNFQFIDVTDNKAAVIGTYTQIGEGSGFSSTYDDPKLIRRFPLDFNESFEDSNSISGEGSFNDITISQNGIGYTKVTYDGYGTIKNSTRTFEDVVRLKTISRDSLTINISFNSISITTRSTTYTYKQAGEPEPLIRLSENNIVTRTSRGNMERENMVMQVSPRLWDPTVGIKSQNNLEGLALMPNPVKNKLQVVLGLKSSTNVRLRLMNMKGQTVKATNLGKLRAGHHLEKLIMSGLPSGSYQLLIQTPEFQKTKTVIKQ